MDSSRRARTTATPPADGLADAALARQLLAAGDRRGPRLALRLGGAQQRVGPAVQRAGPLLGGAQRQPGLHLGGPRRARGLGEPLALGGVRLLLRGVLGRRQSRLELREALEVLVPGVPGGLDRLVEPGGLGPGVAGLGAVLAQLLGHGGQRGVGLVQLGQGDVDPAPRLLALGLQRGHVEAESLEAWAAAPRAARRPRRPRPGPRSGSAGWRTRRRRSGRPAGRPPG